MSEATQSNEALQAAFGQEMHAIYQRALSEAGYKTTRFLHMLHAHGGMQTAKILIHTSTVSEGIRGYTVQASSTVDVLAVPKRSNLTAIARLRRPRLFPSCGRCKCGVHG